MTAPYYGLDELIALIDEPNMSICRELLDDHRDLFHQAPGSTRNHQAWAGGYWDHITDAMNLGVILYQTLEATGRLEQLPPDEQFTLSDVLIVVYLHDIEKPWHCILSDGQPVIGPDNEFAVHPELRTKAERVAFAKAKIAEYGFHLTPAHLNALEFVEGIRDHIYRPDARLMLPLAALCHTCDLLSARMFYDFPLPSGNVWGARLL